jgi:hypothetical protein
MSAEIWGTEIRKDIERIHAKFCKWILRVNTKTCNVMECDRYQMYTGHMVKQVKYWLSLLKCQETDIHAIVTLYELDHDGKSERS